MEEISNNEHIEATSQEESQQEQEAPVQPTPEERNLAALRTARQKAEQERDMYLQKLKAYEAQQQQQQKPAEVEENIDPSDLVEWRHVQKEISKLKEEINSYKTQNNQTTTEARLKSQYPDIEQVLTPDNIAMLKEQDPELASIINDNQNLYTKASVAYKYIKKMGIYQGKDFEKEKNAIDANASKPRSSSASSGHSPLGNAHDFMDSSTEERRKQLYKEMQRYASLK